MTHRRMLAVCAGAVFGMSAFSSAQSLDYSASIANDVVGDAQGRTSLLGGQSAAIRPFAQLQLRYVINSRDEVGPGQEDTAIGFQARRTKIGAEADVERFKIKVIGAFDRDGGTFVLEDAIFSWDMDDNWTGQAGQFKLPFLKEESISSTRQLAAERSITNEFFNQDRSQGVMFTFTDENFRFFGAFSDGFGTANTDFTSGAEADYAFTARGEWKWEGDWTSFEDFTNLTGETAGAVGAAAHWQDGGSTFATMDTQVMALTVDVQYETGQWNLYGAGIWRSIDPAGGTNVDDLGLLAQAGYLFGEERNWEVFARYDLIIPDDDSGGDPDDFHTLTGGVNHYFQEHNAKFTADLSWFLTEQTSMGGATNAPASTGTGLLTSGDDSQYTVRVQMQLVAK